MLRIGFTIAEKHGTGCGAGIDILKMESSELLLLSSSGACGCVRRSCPVRVLYLFDAASNVAVKLVAEGLVV